MSTFDGDATREGGVPRGGASVGAPTATEGRAASPEASASAGRPASGGERPSGRGATLAGNAALERWLAACLGVARASVRQARPLAGGAIQDNWALDVVTDEGERTCVLRRDAPAVIAASRGRAEEFALVEAAWEAGVTVPRPLGFCDDPAVLGAPFALVAYVGGTAYGPKVVRDAALGGDRGALGERLGRELGRIHAIRLDARLAAVLGEPPADPCRAALARLRGWLDAMGLVRPALEWALRHAERHAPPPVTPVLTHQDFRTGNFMVDGEGLTAILDWEFAALDDPMADLGWFCAECWRFSRPDLEAGGITTRERFYAGYAAEGPVAIEPERIVWWELVAHLRWAVIALQQGLRHDDGRQRSLDLALTGRIADTLELIALRMTAPGGSRR